MSPAQFPAASAMRSVHIAQGLENLQGWRWLTLLIRQVHQPNHLSGPPLNSFQFADVFLALEDPELVTLSQTFPRCLCFFTYKS